MTIENPKPGNSEDSSNVQNENNETPLGKKLFRLMKSLDPSQYLSSLLKDDSEETGVKIVTFNNTTLTDAKANSATDAMISNHEGIDAKELQNATMEDVLPLETWIKMSMKDRHYFLDQFYSVRDKFRLERDGHEQCASEELDVFHCTKSQPIFTSSTFFDTSKEWVSRLDSCYVQKERFNRCREMMVMFFKTKRVFGKEYERYLRVVDKDIHK